MKQEVDYLIVGQGIAGTCLSYQLMKQGYSVLVIDKGHHTAASAVAAGLYNPIVFKRFTHSWMAAELITYLNSFYLELEKLLSVQVHRKLPIVKIFTNKDEVNLWSKKSEGDSFFDKDVDYNYYKESLKENAGVGKVKGSGAVDMLALITSYRNYLEQHHSLLSESFDYHLLETTQHGVTYKAYQAKAIIFCEGAQATQNPYFPTNAFKLTHGELFEIESHGLPTNEVVNKGVFMLPFGEGKYRVGATYEWDNIDGKPSEKGFEELSAKLKNVIVQPYKITAHKAGIRPTVVDRRPLMGKSKEQGTMYFFNGLGTKGVMLAPYFSEVMMNHLTNNEPLDIEIDIERFS